MTNRFTPKAKEALESAKEHARGLGHTYVGTEHLLLGIMCTEGVASRLLDDKNVLFTQIYDQVVKISGLGSADALFSALSPRCKRAIEGSALCAKRLGSDFVGTEHLLYAICDERDSAGCRILSALGVSAQALKGEISSLCELIADVDGRSSTDIIGAPTLSLYGKSLSSVAMLGGFDPLIGRKKELLGLIQVLCRRSKNNPCLIGEPGVGKTAIVEGLAQMILNGEAPRELSGKIIVSLDLSSVLAGTKYRGEFEERMRAILSEVNANPSIILFIDEIHTIMGAGGAEGAIDASNIVKPALSRGELRVIGATTIDEYRKSIEKDPALERRFQPIMVEEPSEAESLEILTGLTPCFESFHKIKISPEALEASVRLSQRYIHDRFLPDKALDLLDEACTLVKLREDSSSGEAKEYELLLAECAQKKEEAIIDGDFSLAIELRDKEAELALELSRLKSTVKKNVTLPYVTEADICKIASSKAKVPIKSSKEQAELDIKELEARLRKCIVGQDEAIVSVCSAIKRSALGISSPNRPSASFLFLGPTGVGKTHLAKSIAEIMFKSKNALIRFDMSEYAEGHSISRLIGAPAGYVGYEEGGRLCEAVRRCPYSVVLFDEIEKAHPDIYNLLLQILDEGEIVSTSGKRVDFKNTIIILTSNLGASEIGLPARLGFGSSFSNEESKISDILKKEFSPEFINRLDEIITFKQITIDATKEICELMLEEFTERVKKKGIDLEISSEALELASKRGYDKVYGARQIRRTITTLFENSLCDELLNGTIPLGKRAVACSDGERIYYKCLNI